jgi:chromatin segregation and condensation protein Rec8/ScpA/Scc1 (kleisin family)
LISEEELIKSIQIIRNSREKRFNFLEILEQLEEDQPVEREIIVFEKENFEEYVGQVERLIYDCSLDELCKKYNLDIIKTFLALLFLAAENKVDIYESDGKIYIKKLSQPS